MRRNRLPLWIKLLWTAYAAVLVPTYWHNYGPANFLWFSDIAFLGSVVAMWCESPLLASMMADSVVVPELFWNVGFFCRLLLGIHVSSLSGYMFDPHRPFYLRGLSLFHVAIPFLLIGMVARLGYRRRALLLQVLLGWGLLVLTYVLTKPDDNINWVYGPGEQPQHRLAPLEYLGVVMLFFSLVFYIPTHLLLSWRYGLPPRSSRRAVLGK